MIKTNQCSISIESTDFDMRYTVAGSEIIKIEILDKEFHICPDKPAQWICVGDMFNVFIGFCEDHLANLEVH